MKPNKNRIYCIGCMRHKMLFEEKKKADNFIRFNQDIILEETGKAPVRSYYCIFCSGWHVTSNPFIEQGEKKDKRDLEMIECTNSMNNDISKFKDIISKKIDDIKKAIYSSEDNYDIYKEYEYCRLSLPESMHFNLENDKSKLSQQVSMISDVLSTFIKINLMDLPELKRYITTIGSSPEKFALIKRYALRRIIDLSLEEADRLYESGQADHANGIKEELKSRLAKVDEAYRNEFISKCNDIIDKTFNKHFSNTGNENSGIP